MFEVGKFYESNNGDKLVCRSYDQGDNTWMFQGQTDGGFVVFWAYADGRVHGHVYFGPIVKGPWDEKVDAKVYEGEWASGDAHTYDNARVHDVAWVSGCACLKSVR
jgi:hypothetical protein